MSAARFITLEGGEGAGKTTQLSRLVEWLARCRGLKAVATREPGGTPGAEAIRRLLVEGAPERWDARTEALLLVAARRDHVRAVVAPALASGRWVVSDRFADSTAAYQGIVQGAGLAFVTHLAHLALPAITPDLTLILDLPVDQGLARARARGGGSRYERMGSAFHQRLRQAFLDLAARERHRCAVIDASGSEDDVARRIRAVVAERLP